MSRRMLNTNLGVSKPPSLPVIENVFDMVMDKPKPVQKLIPNEPIFLTKEQWEMICNKTHDVSTPFTVEITVTDNTPQDEEEGAEEAKEEVDETPYVPKKTRRTKK